MVRFGFLLWDWASFLGSWLSVSSSSLFGCHQLCPSLRATRFWWWLSLDQVDSRMFGAAVSYCHLQGLFLSLCWLGRVNCLLWGEISVTHIGLTRVILLSLLLSTTVPQDLMDVSVSNLPSLWQPSPRKSSCSSCSQSGSADGGSTNGCNHERYEEPELHMEGAEGCTRNL